ncbi:hypothetical protein QUF90_05530 [Desulfococcaceae bacterium HSG9]|nr:hypothetical protein [Desulfococcaceae bacterium HSG9]
MPENMAWSAKIKRSGFLPTLNPQPFRVAMQKIAMLNFCAPEFSIC